MSLIDYPLFSGYDMTRKEVKRMRRITAYMLAAVILSLIFAQGCDPRGEFSARETKKLYQELEQEMISDDFWDREITVEKSKGYTEQTIDFFRTALELWHRDYDKESVYAWWAGSKTSYRTCTLYCGDAEIRHNDESFFIQKISIIENNKKGFQAIGIEYKNNTADTGSQKTLIELKK